MPISRSEAAIKYAETRRRQKAEETAKYFRENYFVHGPEGFLDCYPVVEHKLDDVLGCCTKW